MYTPKFKRKFFFPPTKMMLFFFFRGLIYGWSLAPREDGLGWAGCPRLSDTPLLEPGNLSFFPISKDNQCPPFSGDKKDCSWAADCLGLQGWVYRDCLSGLPLLVSLSLGTKIISKHHQFEGWLRVHMGTSRPWSWYCWRLRVAR